MKFFRVRNFEKFQHYKDRNPPWIKLYRSILDDPRFFQLAEPDRFLLLGIFILASQSDNKLPDDQHWLKVKLMTKRQVPIELLVRTEWLEWVEETGVSPGKSASKAASSQASKNASANASAFASPRALAREETEKIREEGEKKQNPLLQSAQTLTVNRSIEAGERLQVTPETLENVWAAIQQQLRQGIPESSWRLYWEPLKLLGFSTQFITVTCPYDPGEDKAWIEDRILQAAIRAGHDRGRRVQLAMVLVEGMFTDVNGDQLALTGVRAAVGKA